jgi:hypothetical protein
MKYETPAVLATVETALILAEAFGQSGSGQAITPDHKFLTL